MDHCVVLVTFPNTEEADMISSKLIDQKLIACANRTDKVISLFRWQNEMEHEQETLVIYKTHLSRLDELTKVVKQNHSYDVPEVIALPIVGGSDEYLQWISDETQK